MITKVPLWMPASDTRDLFGLESMFKRMAQVLASGHASARLPWTRLQDSSETLTVIIDDVCDFPFLHAEWQHQVPSFKYIFHVVEVHCILVANDVRELGLRDVMCEAPSIWWKLQYANDDADSAMWDYVSSSTSTMPGSHWRWPGCGTAGSRRPMSISISSYPSFSWLR